MNSILEIAKWLKALIDKEVNFAYISLITIVVSIGIGILFGYDTNADKRIGFIDIIAKTGGLGISLTSLIGIVYYLFKLDDIENRKSAFLNELIKNESKFNSPEISSSLSNEIDNRVLSILKDKLSEIVEIPKAKKE